MREINQKLMQEKEILLKEKEDLCGICCFLDDDREKAKKVAREWQMFGRYATCFLQKELANWHSKVKDLEQRQLTLVHENRNLKELCSMLDQEQAGSRNSLNSHESLPGPPGSLLAVAGTRDSGDGSSNGSTTSACSPDQRQSGLPLSKEPVYSSGEWKQLMRDGFKFYHTTALSKFCLRTVLHVENARFHLDFEMQHILSLIVVFVVTIFIDFTAKASRYFPTFLHIFLSQCK